MNNNLIIIAVILLFGVITIVFLIRDSYKKFAKTEKAEMARIDLVIAKNKSKFDFMDRVKPGEINLKRKYKGGK